MRVQLEHVEKEIDLEDKYAYYSTESDFLDLVERALYAIGYEVDIKKVEK